MISYIKSYKEKILKEHKITEDESIAGENDLPSSLSLLPPSGTRY
jgi:hypothetical protein